MTDWHQFLLAQGGVIDAGAVAHFDEAPADYEQLLTLDTMCDLADLGVLAVTGAKSADFLHGQTTADFVKSPPPGPIRGACCTPQGRVFTLFTALRTDAGYLLIMPRALIAPSREALARYAALSRVELADVSANYRILGLAGPAADRLASELEGPNGGGSTDGTRALRHAARRYLVLAPTAAAKARWAALARCARPVGLPLWHLADIRDGIATLAPETREQFVPQMLGLEQRGAVSFTKGCYTGQEVVARSQHLGKLKRHLYRLGFAAPAPKPGVPLAIPQGSQPAGTLVAAAPAAAGYCEALAVLRDEAAQCTALEFGDGARAVAFLPLPSAAA
ncbi:MAG: folate-binding protein YgfZ [Pseudomonadales bacterium]|nr:folate-binding protein YgfZ [Pseudomonadales bacterium]